MLPLGLAATSFVVALTVFNGHDKPGAQMLRAQSPIVTAPLAMAGTAVAREGMPAVVPALPEPQDDAPIPRVLPLPPASQPDPGLNAPASAEDEPTVDDLPAPHTPRASSED